MGHAKLSPSSAKRWLNCPGSIRAIDALPVGDTSSRAADEGTFAHLMAEIALNDIGHPTYPEDAIKARLGTVSECGRFTADAELLEHITEYVEFCDDARIKGQASWVEASVKVIHDKVYGTADFIAVVGNVLEVIDYKHGVGVPVSPVDNEQAMTYALGALKRIESTNTKLYDQIDTISIRIFQPRNSRGGGQEIVSKEYLEWWFTEVLEPGATATEDPDAKRKAGDHCQFCPVKGMCYELKDQALEAAKVVFSDPVALEVVSTKPDPKDLTVEEVGKVLAAKSLVEKWLKGVAAYAEEISAKGTAIPGFKRVRKKGDRRWRDVDSAADMLAEMLPDGASLYAEPKLLSPAQSEKLLDVLGKARVKQLTTKPDAGTALVPNSDKRPAFSAGDVFNNNNNNNPE